MCGSKPLYTRASDKIGVAVVLFILHVVVNHFIEEPLINRYGSCTVHSTCGSKILYRRASDNISMAVVLFILHVAVNHFVEEPLII